MSSIEEAAAFWCGEPTNLLRRLSHQRGHLDNWAEPGQEARRMVIDLIKHAGERLPLGTIVEWGIGGGSVANALIGDCDRYVGIDVSEDSARAAREALDDHKRLEVHVVPYDRPEVAEEHVGHADLFVSSWCFTHFPSQAYARRVLEIGARVTHSTGLGCVHMAIDANATTGAYGASYSRHCTMTTPEALDMAKAAGWWPTRIRRGKHLSWLYLTKD